MAADFGPTQAGQTAATRVAVALQWPVRNDLQGLTYWTPLKTRLGTAHVYGVQTVYNNGNMKVPARRVSRTSSLAAAKRISAQAWLDEGDSDSPPPPSTLRKAPKHALSLSPSPPANDASSWSGGDAAPEPEEPAVKRRKTRPARKNGNSAALFDRLFGAASVGRTTTSSPPPACQPPTRRHGVSYHRPLLLDGARGRAAQHALLAWFDAASSARGMPWRKSWVNPHTWPDSDTAAGRRELRAALERRAYEVWISEIMLQQTRVAVVIDYWNRWMARWPTVRDLAAASPDDVLSAWRGLGYYSRATRIHEAAKIVVADPEMRGLLPSGAAELEAKVPGVGRYTAGAISAIVFGRPAAMVDGNVLRVLSRQLGLLGDVKTDRAVIDVLWAAADALVKAAARDGDDGDSDEEPPVNDRPGRWGQALMELGSTVCTPKPDCASCPISSTCRAYAEGRLFAGGHDRGTKQSQAASVSEDIEDMCHLCSPLDETAGVGEDRETEKNDGKAPKKSKGKPGKGTKISSFFPVESSTGDSKFKNSQNITDSKTMATIVEYARKFPVKAIKKAVRVEETLVCAIRRSDGRYLIQKRPEKGLLAGLWEFPSHLIPESAGSTPKARKADAVSYASGVIDGSLQRPASKQPHLKYVKELGSVPWLFSHIKLTMHVYLFHLEGTGEVEARKPGAKGLHKRWASDEDIEAESMGTGMRKCWALVKEAAG